MPKFLIHILILISSLCLQLLYAQEAKTIEKNETLEIAKKKIINKEREMLKVKVAEINKRLAKAEITLEEAQEEKEVLAKKHAANIENRITILENEIALSERNKGDTIADPKAPKITIGLGAGDGDDYIFGVNIENANKKPKYDKRTYSGPVLAVGFNNAVIDGQPLDDSPYKFGGSRFFEMGWYWRTRVFKTTNIMRFNYGFSFQFNGLKPRDNQIFVNKEGQTVLETFPLELKKAKLRMDNFVIPLHLEFGGSEVKKTENQIRYNTYHKFKFGIGGFAGFSMNTLQKLKYINEQGERTKEKIKRDYNRNGLVYGVSSYIGFGDSSLYIKYDLSPMFKNALLEQHNISLGIRFDL